MSEYETGNRSTIRSSPSMRAFFDEARRQYISEAQEEP